MANEPTPAEQLTQQWNTAMQPIKENLNRIGEAFQQVGRALQPQIKAITTLCQEVIYPAIHNAYLDAGAPYGDTHDGLMRWLHEESEVMRHQQAIENIRERQQVVIDFRRQLQRERRDR